MQLAQEAQQVLQEREAQRDQQVQLARKATKVTEELPVQREREVQRDL